MREIVGGFGADLVMDCSGHPSAGPEGIEMLRDGGTLVEMGQFTDAGAIETNWHRICAKDLNVLGSWAFTGNDLPLGVDMLYRSRHRRPWLDMQTLYPFSEEGVGAAIADAMAMRTVKSTIVAVAGLGGGVERRKTTVVSFLRLRRPKLSRNINSISRRARSARLRSAPCQRSIPAVPRGRS